MGMSAEALQGQGAPPVAPGTEGTPGQGPPVTPVPGGPPAQDGGYSQLASEFLQGIPEGQRVLLEPHLRKWDAGVTQKFQELQSQLKPYQELGHDPETLAEAIQLMQIMDERPEVIYKLLTEELGFGQQNQGLPGQQSQQQPPQPPVGQPGQQGPQQVPPGMEQYDQRFGQIETVLGKLAEVVLSGQQTAAQQDEDAQLDAYLSDLKTQFGEFDEDWVVMQIGRGMDGEAAVKAFQSMIQDRINANGGGGGGPGLPPTLSGGSVPPAERVNVGKLPGKDVRALVSGLLEETNRASQ